MEIAVHLIGPPATDEANAVAVDAAAEQRHSAACAGRANRDVGRGVARMRVQHQRGTNAVGEVGGEDVPHRAIRDGSRIQRGVEIRNRALAKGNDAEGKTVNRAQRRVARPPVANCLIAHAIFLVGKREANKRAGEQVGVGAGENGE